MTEIRSLSEGDDVTFDAGLLHNTSWWTVEETNSKDAALFTIYTATLAHNDAQCVLIGVGEGEVSVTTVDGEEVSSIDEGDILLP